MNFKSFDDIIVFAVEKEKEAVAFYKDLAEQSPRRGVKEILMGFAEEEQKHRELLENLGKNKEKLEEYKFEWIPDLRRSDYLVDVAYDEQMGFPELLRLAMKREEASLRLYNQLMKEAGHSDLVRVFKMLAQEEAGHKNKLETIYDDYMGEQGD